jgi:transcriptional regulator with XRE-family HTH domain
MSVRELARRTEVSSTHLSRALRGAKYKSIGGELAGGLAVALDLPIDYFVEYREALVVNAVREDPALRERLYNRLKR